MGTIEGESLLNDDLFQYPIKQGFTKEIKELLTQYQPPLHWPGISDVQSIFASAFYSFVMHLENCYLWSSNLLSPFIFHFFD